MTTEMERRHKRQEIRKSKGLCIHCDNPHDVGFLTCSICRTRLTRLRHSFKEKRRERGLCDVCNEPSAPGRKKCVKHLKEATENAYHKSNAYIMRHIYERDNLTCQVCGRTFEQKRLNLHHIDGSGKENHKINPDANNSPDNLITLCAGCHQAIHKIAFFSKNLDFTISLIKALPHR